MGYNPNIIFRSAHINTCYPTLFRRIDVPYVREQIETPDGDFFHVDWLKRNSRNLLILCHGIEGSTQSKYIKGMAKYFFERDWDIAAMNFRSCSGEMNRLLKAYHMGETDDLDLLLSRNSNYQKIALVGFSMGGNIILKYLGEAKEYPKNLIGSAVVSPPCHIPSSSLKLELPENFIYKKQFLDSLKEKALKKSKIFPEALDFKKVISARNLTEFDNAFTAPINGFKDAIDYYEKSSSIYVLERIALPSFILTPLDDPMMSGESYPFEIAEKNSCLTLECPHFGGHVGFSSFKDYPYWHEERIYDFIQKIK